MYKRVTKRQALFLRTKGLSLAEIAYKLNISKSTSSLWLSNITLTNSARERIFKRTILGQYKGVLTMKRKRENEMSEKIMEAEKTLSYPYLSNALAKLCCTLLWWCEGNKTTSWVRFTNSDISTITLFLLLFRMGFDPEEKKFRALIHIHNYHDQSRQKLFWSKITHIPLLQFNKSYQKKNSSTRKKTGYEGCISITYYDARIAKEMLALYTVFCRSGGIVQRQDSGFQNH